MSDVLSEHRREAAEASGGTSPGTIKELIVRIIAENQLRGNFLDFGAGKGELVRGSCPSRASKKSAAPTSWNAPKTSPTRSAGTTRT